MFSRIALETGLRLGLAGAGRDGGGGLSGSGILVHRTSTSRSRYLGFALGGRGSVSLHNDFPRY
jgi:hypothetical protein